MCYSPMVNSALKTYMEKTNMEKTALFILD